MTAPSARSGAGWRALVLFLVAAAVYGANLRTTASFDSYATSLLPFRILSGRGLGFTTADAAVPVAYSIVPSRAGGFVSFYPVVTALLATPLYVPAVAFAPSAEPGAARVLMEKAAASVLAAGSVALLFLALARLTTKRVALLLALLYAFGTLTWAVSSQALWLQTGSELLLAAALWLLARGPGSARGAASLGVVCGLMAANRPTDGLFALALAWLVWRRGRERFLPFAAAAGAVGAAAVAWNLVHFGHPLGGYGLVFLAGGNLAGGTGLAGLAGLLVSNRGLLVFSPFLFALALYRPTRARLPGTTLLLGAYLVSLWIHGRSFDWWGGYCYGARYTLHGLPVLFVALIAPVEHLLALAWGRAFLACAGAASALCEIAGAFFYPAGDSGNAGFGPWAFRKAPPLLAFAAGPPPPEFLGLIVPRLGMPPAPVSERDAAARLSFRGEPPAVWRPNERRPVGVVVENRGPISWKGLGGFMNTGGVRLSLRWRRDGDSSDAGLETTEWLALRLRSGRTAERVVEVQAPPEAGRYVLSVGLSQLGLGPFPPDAAPELVRPVSVARAEDGVEWETWVPAELDPNLGGRARVRVRGGAEWALAWRWRRPGGAVIRVDGPAALTPEPDGWLRADLELATHIVAGTYVLEFGLVDPRRPEAFQSVAPSVRVTLTGSWAAGITGKRTRP